MTLGALVDASTGDVLVRRIVRADTPWQRTVGLLGRAHLNDDDGMYLEGCAAIHTFFMRTKIDVLFLDSSGALLDVLTQVGPWRACRGARSAFSTLELAPGAAERLALRRGRCLAMRWAA